MQAAQIQVGDLVRIGGWHAWFRVADVEDPALLVLETESGARLKAGRLSISEIQRPTK